MNAVRMMNPAFSPLNDVFPELFRGLTPVARTTVRSKASTPSNCRLDVKETSDTYVVYADLPGVAKDEINVQIDGDTVSISATIKPAGELVDGEKMLRTERYLGEVARTIVLANEIDEDAASAQFENGVLALTLPKKVAPAAKRLAIG